jgi:hypothetical protein
MSSLATRTLRTTAAAAGMAALGVGLAGNALAAPSTPTSPQTGSTPALPALPALPTQNPLASLPGVPDGTHLPMLFVFQGPTVHSPTVNTAGPSRLDQVRLPVAAPVRTTPSASVGTETTPAHVGPTQAGSTHAGSVSPQPDQVGALSALDSAALFRDLAPQSVVDQQGLGTSGLGLHPLG